MLTIISHNVAVLTSCHCLVSVNISRLPLSTCCWQLHLWMEFICFICTCKQVFISALHSCIQFIQMMKNIYQVCHPCTPLITCKKICVIRSLIRQKHLKFLPQLVQTRPCRATTTGPPYEAARFYSFRRFPHTKMRFFTGRDFAKFTMRTTSSNTGHRSAGKVLAMRASRCKKQCVTITSGFLSFTLLTKHMVLRPW